MLESRNSQRSNDKLPAVVPETANPEVSSHHMPASGRALVLSTLSALAPLALEVIYGITRKWLSKSANGVVDNRIGKQPGLTVRQSLQNSGRRRRYR